MLQETSPNRHQRRGALISGAHVLALADQAVVSGISFLTTVLVGRWTDASQLGAYALAMSVLASLFIVQESLILLPYSIQRHRPAGTAAEHAGGSLILSFLLSAAALAALAVVALGLSARGAGGDIVAMVWAVAFVAPFVLLREFGRLFAFARLQTAQALILDATAAAIQVTALIGLEWSGRMSAVAACASLAAACAISALGWLYLARKDFAIRFSHVRPTLGQSWNLAKWLFVGRLTMMVQGYSTYWLSLMIAGATVTGVYAACMSILAFANPLMFGFRNILTPRAALAWKNGGGPALLQQTIRDAYLFAAMMTGFCVVVLVWGAPIMQILYRGQEYVGLAHTLTVLSLATLVLAVDIPAGTALAAMERPRAIVIAGAAGAAVTVAVVSWLMSEWGLLGAAYGIFAGNLVRFAGCWGALFALAARGHRSDSAAGSSSLQSTQSEAMEVAHA